MINKIKKGAQKITQFINKNPWFSEGQQAITLPETTSAKFTLTFQELIIGYLYLKDNLWSFEYSEEFKAQQEIKPLTDFIDVDKVYSSEELYPFFTQRIPSLSQPKVKALVKEEKIETNLVVLLKRFGKLSITDPFKLTAAF